MEAHWPMNSPLARHAAAADLWMELTGRKSAAVLEIAKEAMEKRAEKSHPRTSPETLRNLAAMHFARQAKEANGDMVAAQSEPKPMSKAPLIGAGVGGAAGAGLLGAAAHHSNKGLAAAARIPRHLAALGGGTIGAGLGATAGAGYLIHKAMKPAAATKTGSAASAALEYLRSHPRAASAAGAALLAVPVAAGGYLHEKARHTPGAGGKSSFEIDNEQALAGYRARAEHSGKPSIDGKPSLREKYLLLQERAGHEGSADPRRAAAIGAIPYAALAAMTGATMAPRLLQW